MKLRIALALAITIAPAAASAMPVATFLAKANALKAKGPFALLSGDLKLLTNEIKANSIALRAENEAAAKAGHRKAYCTPPGGAQLSQDDIMQAMQAVPASSRDHTDTKDALRAFLARRYPCPR
jgi:hypothetical protein